MENTSLHFFYYFEIIFEIKQRYVMDCLFYMKKVSEYDQEIPQSHSADQPTTPCGRAATRHQEYKQSGSTCSLSH